VYIKYAEDDDGQTGLNLQKIFRARCVYLRLGAINLYQKHHNQHTENEPVNMSLLPTIVTIIPYLLQAVAFAVRPALWLRLGLVAAFTLQIGYWIYIPFELQFIHIAGASVLLLINLFQAVVLLRARNVDAWSDEERYLQSTAFRSLPNVVFKKLMDIAEWRTVHKNDIIVAESSDVERLVLIFDGTATVQIDGKPITYLRENSFIGEMSFLTGNPASATVKASTPMRLLTWRKAELYDLMAKEPDLKNGLQTLFSYDLAGKLSKQNSRN
jgi:uncharacterized beta-barrel protein YwiB (DUF1934 family)